MSNYDRDLELELGMFGEYILKARVVPEKCELYYVRWVRKFRAMMCRGEPRLHILSR